MRYRCYLYQVRFELGSTKSQTGESHQVPEVSLNDQELLGLPACVQKKFRTNLSHEMSDSIRKMEKYVATVNQ